MSVYILKHRDNISYMRVFNVLHKSSNCVPHTAKEMAKTFRLNCQFLRSAWSVHRRIKCEKREGWGIEEFWDSSRAHEIENRVVEKRLRCALARGLDARLVQTRFSSFHEQAYVYLCVSLRYRSSTLGGLSILWLYYRAANELASFPIVVFTGNSTPESHIIVSANRK